MKENLKEKARNQETLSPEGYLLGLVLIVGWHWSLRLPGAWGWTAFFAGPALLFLWGALERKLEPHILRRRRARADADGRPAQLGVVRRVIRHVARAILFVLVLVVVLGVFFYGAMLLTPSILLIIPFDTGGAIAGLPIGAAIVYWWVRYVSRHVIGAAGMAAAAGVAASP